MLSTVCGKRLFFRTVFFVNSVVDIKFVNGASYVTNWITSDEQDTPMTYESRKINESFPCSEPLCILQFNTESELHSHYATDNHQYVKTKTGIDKAILYFADQKHIQSVSTQETASEDMDVDQMRCNKPFLQTYCRGWARKIRKVCRFTVKQKEFIALLFKKGASTKNKLSAEQMAQMMKDEMVDGHHYFTPHEYLEPKRIRGLISQFKKKEVSQPESKVIAFSEEDGILHHMDEICDSLFESESEDN